MYNPEDLVVYGIHGVCQVKELERMTVGGKVAEFLVLEPLNQEGARFMIPADNPAALEKISPLMTPEKLEQLLTSENVHSGQWQPVDNLRKQNYKDLISGKDREKLLREICTIYKHKNMLAAMGRKNRQFDENFLIDAEKRMCGEIAAVMGIPLDAALKYLREKLQ